MSWVAVGIGASAVIGAAASNNASKKQMQGANNALQMQQDQFNTVRADTAPAREIGTNALYKLADILGIDRAGPSAPTREQFMYVPGQDGSHRKNPWDPWNLGEKLTGEKFSATNSSSVLDPGGIFGKKKKKDAPTPILDEGAYNAAMDRYRKEQETFNARPRGMDALQLDPGYQFRLDNTNRTIDRYQSANRLTGGRAIKEATRYGQDFASGEVNNATNRLFTLAGYGPQAINQSASAGMNAANQGAQYSLAAGNAQANNYVNQANTLNNAMTNYTTYRTYNDWMNKLGK